MSNEMYNQLMHTVNWAPVESPPIKQGFVMFTCVNTVET